MWDFSIFVSFLRKRLHGIIKYILGFVRIVNLSRFVAFVSFYNDFFFTQKSTVQINIIITCIAEPPLTSFQLFRV